VGLLPQARTIEETSAPGDSVQSAFVKDPTQVLSRRSVDENAGEATPFACLAVAFSREGWGADIHART